MEITMYNTLLQLPLFQGLGHHDLTAIIEKVQLHFSKHKAGDRLIREGQTCDHIIFLLKGEINVATNSHMGKYTYSEIINGPCLIELQSLFGRETVYISTYYAASEIQLIKIEKKYVLSELSKYEIFQMNMHNILSNRSQLLLDKVWNYMANGTENKIINFFLMHSERPVGKKVVRIKMEDLAFLIDDTRLNVSRVLNEMQELGHVILRRKEIEVPDLSTLIKYSKDPDSLIYWG